MIAILLASYNGENYIEEQLRSILNQTKYVEEEYVVYVHDDGSTDRTLEIVKELEKAYPARIKILDGAPQGGSTMNFMFMLDSVESDYYMFSDQDDIWLDTKIKREFDEIKRLEKEKSSDSALLVFSDMKVVDESLRVINESFYSYSNLKPHRTKLNELILENVVSGCCMMFNRKLRDLALGLDDISKIKWHDWWIAEVASSMDETKGCIAYIDEPLMLYRQHGANSVGAVEDVNTTRVKNKLVMILNGDQSRETKKYIREALNQGKQLGLLGDEISLNSSDIIKALMAFDNQSKIHRILSFVKHKISRDKRNIWMMLHL